MAQGIYEIRNTKSGTVYVGQSVDTEKRMQDHHCSLMGNRHINKLLQDDWNTYGRAVFVFKHVETVYREALLLIREQERINDYEENNVMLYNRAGARRVKYKPLRKISLSNSFQGYKGKPLVLKYLTFKDKPTPPERAINKFIGIEQPALPEGIAPEGYIELDFTVELIYLDKYD